ncbi:hypothetical protein HDU87_000449 [Geranomyces variabilis]|uniref:DUF4436 domain-containing protein n=1 Tax=Geranomyces variabilis TaxID=109894 RepID=A0AAD5XSF5_9FUNG|nr:hypothetical protein HDU87_000449 [Geranomyces variabilis]
MPFRLPARKRDTVRSGLAFLGIAGLMALVLGLGITNLKRSNNKHATKENDALMTLSRPDLVLNVGGGAPPQPIPGTLQPGQAALNIIYTVGKLDPIAEKTARIFIEFYPVGTLSPFNGTDLNDWADSLGSTPALAAFTVTTSYKTFTFRAGERPLRQEQTMVIGDADRYPLDHQDLEDYITATYVDPATNRSTLLPVTVVDDSWQQGWNFVRDPTDSANSPTVGAAGSAQPAWNFALIAKRNATTKILSFGIIGLMWLLSLTYFVVGFRVVSTDRKVDLTVAALGATLMFGMNALRSVQPGIPPTGCIADTFGYMWNMCLLALCCIIAVAHYLWRIDRLPQLPPPPQPPQPQYKEVA